MNDELYKVVDEDKFAEYFKSRVSSNKCPLCGESNWDKPYHAGRVNVLSFSDSPIYNQAGYVFIYITCNICGYTFAIDALKLKLLKPSKTGDESNA